MQLMPAFLQLQRGGHRAVATDDDERLHPQPVENRARLRDDFRRNDRAIARAHFGHKMSAVGRPEDGAAERHDAVGSAAIEDQM